ncbi:unnamed protein product [Angiostrongylus costaricensis]|uniref:SCP domain-containing protein n=1 Tax=Angiostrongylus costaricensis TaxID=334426 RepID=A0A0R3PQ84_ANGCS|nr:unnamed protein product [Angiostrongylus costaricensis]
MPRKEALIAQYFAKKDFRAIWFVSSNSLAATGVASTCDKSTTMTQDLRQESFYYHNAMRWILQNARTTREYIPDPYEFPTAFNMSLLSWDCELEKKAYEIAKSCPTGNRLDFQYTGSNNYTTTGPVTKFTVGQAVLKWMDTLHNGNDSLVNLTPSENNAAKIPGLQLIIGNMTQVGCAFYQGCKYESGVEFTPFVCEYGPPPLKVGVPIYQNGTPCGACNGPKSSSCFQGLCNYTSV